MQGSLCLLLLGSFITTNPLIRNYPSAILDAVPASVQAALKNRAQTTAATEDEDNRLSDEDFTDSEDEGEEGYRRGGLQPACSDNGHGLV